MYKYNTIDTGNNIVAMNSSMKDTDNYTVTLDTSTAANNIVNITAVSQMAPMMTH